MLCASTSSTRVRGRAPACVLLHAFFQSIRHESQQCPVIELAGYQKHGMCGSWHRVSQSYGVYSLAGVDAAAGHRCIVRGRRRRERPHARQLCIVHVAAEREHEGDAERQQLEGPVP